jgi:hypothetical protein
MDIKEAVKIVSAVTRYAYNVSGHDFARNVYGREFDSYVEEKFLRMQESLTNYFGSLDSDNREKFVAAALKRYPGGKG